MNDEQRADRLFQTWLESEVPTAVPQGLLDRIDTATRTRRPRPAWLARLEGHHMDVIEGGRRTAVPRLSLVLTIIGLILAAAAVVASVASQHDSIVVNPSPSPEASPSLTAEISPEPSVEPSLETRPARVVTAGSLIEGRSQHAATVLADGRVLIVGGLGQNDTSTRNALTSTEIWDPLTNSTVASGSIDPEHFWARFSEEAFLLPDGRVLVVPGDCPCGSVMDAPAEIWDPSSGTWGRIDTLTIPRAARSATLLDDGRVLVAGGWDSPHGGGVSAAAFTWDLIREKSTPTGSMLAPRGLHSATRLADGRVLLVGGNYVPGTQEKDPVSSAEVWDPNTGSFRAVPSLSGVRGTAITLPDGRVLIVGEAGAVLWDPQTESTTTAGSFLHPRMEYTATLLTDGRVLIVGGSKFVTEDAPGDPILEIELWDPDTLSFAVAGTLSGPRPSHTTTALPDGRALIVGGHFGDFHNAPIQPIEVWEPARG